MRPCSSESSPSKGAHDASRRPKGVVGPPCRSRRIRISGQRMRAPRTRMAVRNSGKCQGPVRAFRVTSCSLWDFHLSWNRLRPEVAPGTPDALSRCRVMDASGSVSNNGSAISRSEEEKEVRGSVALSHLPEDNKSYPSPALPRPIEAPSSGCPPFGGKKNCPMSLRGKRLSMPPCPAGELGRSLVAIGTMWHGMQPSSRPRGAGLRPRQQSSMPFRHVPLGDTGERIGLGWAG